MSYTEWKDKTTAFKTIDVRGVQGNFFQGLKKQRRGCCDQIGQLCIKDQYHPLPICDAERQPAYLQKQNDQTENSCSHSAISFKVSPVKR